MTVKFLETKTQLQIKREVEGVSVYDLARSIVNIYGDKCGGDVERINTVISDLEANKGILHAPKARKSYELKYIARRLNCNVEDLI